MIGMALAGFQGPLNLPGEPLPSRTSASDAEEYFKGRIPERDRRDPRRVRGGGKPLHDALMDARGWPRSRSTASCSCRTRTRC
jgi:hypothetical protein